MSETLNTLLLFTTTLFREFHLKAKSMLTPKRSDNRLMTSWDVFGKYYGFPACCIHDFHLGKNDGTPRKLDGTGYVPCPECNKKTEQELIQAINLNRLEPIPFPSALVGSDSGHKILASPDFSEFEKALVVDHMAAFKRSCEDDYLVDNIHYYFEICNVVERKLISVKLAKMKMAEGADEDAIFYEIVKILRANPKMMALLDSRDF